MIDRKEEIREKIKKSKMTPSQIGVVAKMALDCVRSLMVPGEGLSRVIDNLELIALVAKEEWDRIPSHEIH